MQPPKPPQQQRTISITCRTHGARGFCNLRMVKEDDRIVLDPHVTGACVLELEEQAATEVRDTITEWLGD